MSEIPLIVIAGPTACGKTALSLGLGLDAELIGADSMQIYKYMDIGTAKPTPKERSMAVHHLIDFVEPTAEFSVADYCALAHNVIADITARGKLAVMVGGTGLYINSVVNDVDFTEVKTDYELREYYTELARREGNERLIEILSEFDPKSAKALHPNNVKRVVRAIEFYKTTGIPISEHQEKTKLKKSRYYPIMLMPDWDREILYDRINKRVDIMLDEGLVDEVKRLRDMGCTRSLNSMQGIGYKEIFDYLEGKCTLKEAAEQIKQASRNYAKRQLTWFRRDERIIRLNPEPNMADRAREIIERELESLNGRANF